MLVLTRRMGETLVVGDNIKITIVGVKGGQVRLGIDAPKEVSIQREELLFKNDVIDQAADALEDKTTLESHH